MKNKTKISNVWQKLFGVWVAVLMLAVIGKAERHIGSPGGASSGLIPTSIQLGTLDGSRSLSANYRSPGFQFAPPSGAGLYYIDTDIVPVTSGDGNSVIPFGTGVTGTRLKVTSFFWAWSGPPQYTYYVTDWTTEDFSALIGLSDADIDAAVAASPPLPEGQHDQSYSPVSGGTGTGGGTGSGDTGSTPAQPGETGTSGTGGTSGSGGSGGSGGSAGSPGTGAGAGGAGGTGGTGGTGGAGGAGGAGGQGGQGGQGGVTSLAGVESRLDTANTRIKEQTDYIKSATGSDAIGSANSDASSRASTALQAGQAAADAITKDDRASAVGLIPSSPADSNDTSFTITFPVEFGGFQKTWNFDPVNMVKTKYASMALACKTFIALLVVSGVYVAYLKGAFPLVSMLPSNEAVSEATKVNIAPWGIGATFSALRPLLTLARVGILLVFPVALVATIEIYLSYVGSDSGVSIGNSGVPGMSLFAALTNAFSVWATAGGRAFQLVNLFLPLATIAFSTLYVGGGYLAMAAVYLSVKLKAAALQSF